MRYDLVSFSTWVTLRVDLLVWLTEQALDAQQHTAGVQRRTPCTFFPVTRWLQDVQADAPTHVNIRVVDWCFEEDFWWCEWIIGRVGACKLECKILIRRPTWSGHGCIPFRDIGAGGKGVDTRYRVGHESTLR